MSLKEFPEIENFQRLPREVIVKGTISEETEGLQRLHGIVINNVGHAVTRIRVNAVLFDDQKLPIRATNALVDPEKLEQGAIGTFALDFKELPCKVKSHYLHANWSFDYD